MHVDPLKFHLKEIEGIKEKNQENVGNLQMTAPEKGSDMMSHSDGKEGGGHANCQALLES